MGEPLPAADAVAWCLVTEVTEATEGAHDRAADLARRFASGPAAALGVARRLTRVGR